jgi:hypothetical protein
MSYAPAERGMSFTVQKSLGNSLFRFAVSRRRELSSIDETLELSTSPTGEFTRHRPEIFYSADLRAIRTPALPPLRSIASTPFWTSFLDGTRRGWAMVGAMALGAIFVLFGLAVLANNGSQGWVVIIFGLILLGVPVFFASQKRRAVRIHEEKNRKEREEREARNGELLAAFAGALERLREDLSDAALEHVLRENEKLDLPYAVWADTAIGTVLHVGFSTLARVGPERAAEVAALMDRASSAAGLINEDARGVKHAIYSTVLWHLLADDRLGTAQTALVRAIQNGFAIKDDEVPVDTSSEAQFIRLRGIDHRNAPRCESSLPLGMNEYCMHSVPLRAADGTTPTIYVTNKRVIVEGDKRIDAAVRTIDDLFVDADAGQVVIRASTLKKPLDFLASEPIYLAAMIDLATRLDDRPKSFM